MELAIKGGVSVVQLREKECSSREFYEMAKAVKTITDAYEVPLLINDRIDIALAVGADGVHLGQSDLPLDAARNLLGADKIVGATANTVELAQKAWREGADYLGVGDVFGTTTKADTRHITLEELKEEMTSLGEKPYRAEQIFKWIYKDKVKEFDEMTNLSIELREKLQQNYTMCNFKILKKQESSDGTKKYLFDVLDENAIETVLMQYHHGKTICVSSQIGCKMGCKFCASTGINFVRNLTAGEIVEQIVAVEQDIGEEISNIVFMGIGEPLDNFDNVIKAIKIMNNPKGLNIGGRHISISTCGVVPKIYELANQKLQCTLSISLHATNNNKRSSMMPINNRYQIEELIKACKDYIKATNKRVSFEYALAKDNNDNLEDAKELVKLLKGMICHVNLIPINKIENGEFSKSTNENIIRFRDYLNEHGIVATIRRELGSDIDAACGQLRRKEMKKE